MTKLKATVAIVIVAIAIGGAVYYKNRNRALEQICFILDQTQKSDYVKSNVNLLSMDFNLAVKTWESYSQAYAKALLNEFGLKDTLHMLSVDEDSLEPETSYKLKWVKNNTLKSEPYADFLSIKMILELRGKKEFIDLAKSNGITDDAAVIERMWQKASLKMTEAIIDEFGAKKAIRMLTANPEDPNEINGRDQKKMLQLFGNISSQILNERSNSPASSH